MIETCRNFCWFSCLIGCFPSYIISPVHSLHITYALFGITASVQFYFRLLVIPAPGIMSEHQNRMPDAIIDPEQPAGRAWGPGNAASLNYCDCLTIAPSTPGSGLGVFTKQTFEKHEVILCSRAAVAMAPGILLPHARGRQTYNGAVERIIDCYHIIEAVMRTYERTASRQHSLRPFEPCRLESEVTSVLREAHSNQVDLERQILAHLWPPLTDDVSRASQAQDNTGSQHLDDLQDTYETAAARVLRFLDGAIVAEDIGEHFFVYSHLTSYLNFSCIPNAILTTFSGEQPHPDDPFAVIADIELKALRPINEGEEITIGYSFGVTGTRDERRRAMRGKFGFECQCSYCLNATHERTFAKLMGHIFPVFDKKDTDAPTQAFYRHCGQMFDVLEELGIHDHTWLIMTTFLAHLMLKQTPPDPIRAHYFFQQARAWSREWLGKAHTCTIRLGEALSTLESQSEDTAAFAKHSWEYLSTESARGVLFLLDSPPKNRLSGLDCVRPLSELQKRQRKQMRAFHRKKNRAKKPKVKKAKKQQEGEHDSEKEHAEEDLESRTVSAGVSPTVPASDGPSDLPSPIVENAAQAQESVAAEVAKTTKDPVADVSEAEDGHVSSDTVEVQSSTENAVTDGSQLSGTSQPIVIGTGDSSVNEVSQPISSNMTTDPGDHIDQAKNIAPISRSSEDVIPSTTVGPTSGQVEHVDQCEEPSLMGGPGEDVNRSETASSISDLVLDRNEAEATSAVNSFVDKTDQLTGMPYPVQQPCEHSRVDVTAVQKQLQDAEMRMAEAQCLYEEELSRNRELRAREKEWTTRNQVLTKHNQELIAIVERLQAYISQIEIREATSPIRTNSDGDSRSNENRGRDRTSSSSSMSSGSIQTPSHTSDLTPNPTLLLAAQDSVVDGRSSPVIHEAKLPIWKPRKT
jgi:hypothetical protein